MARFEPGAVVRATALTGSNCWTGLRQAGARPLPQADLGQEIRILRNSNVREGAPSTTARIVRVAVVNTTETVSGFTDQGERVAGNSYWYRTQDGNYFWAGATDLPHPVTAPEPRPVPWRHFRMPARRRDFVRHHAHRSVAERRFHAGGHACGNGCPRDRCDTGSPDGLGISRPADGTLTELWQFRPQNSRGGSGLSGTGEVAGERRR